MVMHSTIGHLSIIGILTLTACGNSSDTGTDENKQTLTDYEIRCRDLGVPIPPDWGSLSWFSEGELSTTLLTDDQKIYIFSYESSQPAGLCVALSRGDQGFVTNLGVICQGQDSGRACFWDIGGQPVPDAVPISEFLSADEISFNLCTACHQGPNAFLIHPGTALDLGPLTQSSIWYTPVAPDTWPPNPQPSTQLNEVELGSDDSSCLTCHNEQSNTQLPTIDENSFFYCWSVLKPALKETMPPGSISDPKYQKHRDALLNLCEMNDPLINEMQRTFIHP